MCPPGRSSAEEPHQTRGARVLPVAIGSMLLFRVSTEGRFTAYFTSATAMGFWKL